MSIATNLHAITRPCNTVPGSLKWIALIDPDDLVTRPRYYLLPNLVDLEFKPGKSAYAFEATPLTSRMVDTTQDSDAGDSYQYALNANLKNFRLEVELLRAKLRNRRVHVLVCYMDNLQRFIPSMRIFMEGDSGTKSEPNQYRVQAIATLRKPAPTLDATIEISGGSGDSETTPPSSGTGPVQITTTDGSYTYTIPSGKLLVAIFMRSTDDQVVAIGTSAGGTEISGAWVPMTALESAIFGDSPIKTTTSTPIYFSGLVGTNTIELWLLG